MLKMEEEKLIDKLEDVRTRAIFTGGEKGHSLYIRMQKEYGQNKYSSRSAQDILNAFENDNKSAIEWLTAGIGSGCIQLRNGLYTLTQDAFESLEELSEIFQD